MEMKIIYSITMKIPTLVSIKETLHDGAQTFQFCCGICSTEEATNYFAQKQRTGMPQTF